MQLTKEVLNFMKNPSGSPVGSNNEERNKFFSEIIFALASEDIEYGFTKINQDHYLNFKLTDGFFKRNNIRTTIQLGVNTAHGLISAHVVVDSVDCRTKTIESFKNYFRDNGIVHKVEPVSNQMEDGLVGIRIHDDFKLYNDKYYLSARYTLSLIEDVLNAMKQCVELKNN